MRIFWLLLGLTALLIAGVFAGIAIDDLFLDDKPGAAGKGGPGSGGPPSGGRPARGGSDGGPASRPGATGVPVVTAPTLVAAIRERISGSGLLEAERTVTITARVEGEIESISVEEADELEAGTVLCAIDRSQLEISELQARVEKERDDREYERMLDLSQQERPVVSPKEVDDARFAKDRSHAAHQQALIQLSYSEPKAPFESIVVERFVDKGQHVRLGDPLFTISDFRPLLLRLSLPEVDVRHVSVGQIVELRIDRDSPALATGSVLRIRPVVDPETLNVQVTVSFDVVPEPLRPGSFARADIITRTHEDVILVPRAAVVRQKEGPSFVFRVLPTNHVQRVEVETGYEDELVIEIRESGLKPGDLVVVEGNRDLRDNVPVREYRRIPVESNPLSVTPNGEG